MFLKNLDSKSCRVDNNPRSIFSDSNSKKGEYANSDYKKGYIKGKEDGIALGKKITEEKLRSDYEKAYKNIEDSVKKLDETRLGYLNVISILQSELPKLIIAITEKLIASKLNSDDGSIIKNIVKEISKKITSEFTIYVSEDDKNRLDADGAVEIKVDKSLKPGDLILDWKYGRVDGRIETKIKNIEKWINGINLEDFIKKD